MDDRKEVASRESCDFGYFRTYTVGISTTTATTTTTDESAIDIAAFNARYSKCAPTIIIICLAYSASSTCIRTTENKSNTSVDNNKL